MKTIYIIFSVVIVIFGIAITYANYRIYDQNKILKVHNSFLGNQNNQFDIAVWESMKRIDAELKAQQQQVQ